MRRQNKSIGLSLTARPMSTKVMSMREAIARFVKDGDTVVLGAALEHAIPFAAGHELIRQGRRNLTLVGPISDILFDQLIGAGCVARVEAAWVGNVAAGSGYNFRRAAETGRLEILDHSNLSIALRLKAASLGVPFLPTKSLLGSDIARGDFVKEVGCPFTGERLVFIRALQPDVTIVYAQRTDKQGNAHLWGNLGITAEAASASHRTILIVEELVDESVIRANPNLVAFPGLEVDAVVVEPFGAHPSPLAGYYHRDHAHFLAYHEASRTEEGFRRWLEEWVLGVSSRAEYLKRIDTERFRIR